MVAMRADVWEVVGGADKGGIIVRTGPDLSSPQEAQRLATGALVECDELLGDRMRFRKVAGHGPASGWVSVRLKDKELLTLANHLFGISPDEVMPSPPEELKPPQLVVPVEPAKPKQPATPPALASAPRAEPGKPAPPQGPAHKRIWFVRHGEAEHNVLIDQGLPSSHLRDPGLSVYGKEQARSLVADPLLGRGALSPLGSDLRAQLVVSSPCKRALETASELSRDAELPIYAWPDLQECTDNPCDTGRPKADLEREFPGVDLSACHDRWFEKMGSNRGDAGRDALRRRCERLTDWLARRPEERLVVVAHRTLFCYLLQVDFAPAEVIEMWLKPPGSVAPGGLRQAAARQPMGAQGWRWEEGAAADKLVDFYNHKNEPLCSQGSPPLRGTLRTCRLNRGEEAWRNTLRRLGFGAPPSIPGLI